MHLRQSILDFFQVDKNQSPSLPASFVPPEAPVDTHPLLHRSQAASLSEEEDSYSPSVSIQKFTDTFQKKHLGLTADAAQVGFDQVKHDRLCSQHRLLGSTLLTFLICDGFLAALCIEIKLLSPSSSIPLIFTAALISVLRILSIFLWIFSRYLAFVMRKMRREITFSASFVAEVGPVRLILVILCFLAHPNIFVVDSTSGMWEDTFFQIGSPDQTITRNLTQTFAYIALHFDLLAILGLWTSLCGSVDAGLGLSGASKTQSSNPSLASKIRFAIKKRGILYLAGSLVTLVLYVVFQLRVTEFGSGLSKNVPQFGTTETRLLPPQTYFDLFSLAFSVVTLVGNPGFGVSTVPGQVVVYISTILSVFFFVLTVLCFLDHFDFRPSEELPYKVYQLVRITEEQQSLAATVVGLQFRLWKSRSTGPSSTDSLQRAITQTSMRLRKLRIARRNLINKQQADASLLKVAEKMEKNVADLTQRLRSELRRVT